MARNGAQASQTMTPKGCAHRSGHWGRGDLPLSGPKMSAGNASRNRTLPEDKGMHAHCIFEIKDKAKCDGIVALPGCLTFVGTKDAQSCVEA